MTTAEQDRWLALLPSVVTEDSLTLADKFPIGKRVNFKAFANSVTTIIALIRRRRERGESDVDVPIHVYEKRRRLVLIMEEVFEEKSLKTEDFEEWQEMLGKIRRGDLFTDEEEARWFRRLSILEKMKDEDFTPCAEFDDLYAAYISVSSTLRHVRRLKEVEEKSLRPIDEDGDDDMRIGDSPLREPEALIPGEGTGHASPLNTPLELLP